MDRVYNSQFLSSSQRPAASQEFIGLSDITGFLRRYVRTILACLAVTLLMAWFYNSTTDPVYTATTQILIEPKLPQHFQQGGREVNLSLDTAQLESQIAVMQSEKIASMVIEELGLVDDPKFNQPHTPAGLERFSRMWKNITDTLGLGTKSWPVELEQRFNATEQDPARLSNFQRMQLTSVIFHKNLDVRRVGVSYAINISFTSLDPQDAARIANATADAFVREQIETKAEAAKQGGHWLEVRLGELRAQMNEAMAQAQAFRSRHDYSVGASHEEENGKPLPSLEELEVTAETYRKMYESFLQAYTNSVSQQSYPVADARVITAAMPPLVPSAPRPKLMLAFAAAAGIMLGIGLAFIRQTFDWTIRSPAHIRDNIGLECVGELPPIGRWRNSSQIDEVVRAPNSRYSRNLRNARVEISLAETDHPIKFLGLTAVSHDGSKTAIASNLAALYAMSGLKTLVIDADVQRPAISAWLLGEGNSARGPLHEALELNIIKAPGRSFDILPASVVDARNLVSPRIMQTFLSSLSSYDIVIVDLPTFAAGPDRLAVSSVLDGVVVVAEWGKTQADTLGDLVKNLQASRTQLLGILLANSRALTKSQRKP